MMDDPYQSPLSGYSQPPYEASLRQSVKKQCLILGIIFIVLSVLGFVGALLASLGNLIPMIEHGGIPPEMESLRNRSNEAEDIGFVAGFYGSVIGMVLSALVQPFILWAGVNFVRVRGLGMARMGAIVSLIPGLTSCCCLGLPFGIWALILLSNPETKALFQSSQRPLV